MKNRIILILCFFTRENPVHHSWHWACFQSFLPNKVNIKCQSGNIEFLLRKLVRFLAKIEHKVEKILKGSLDLIPTPSPSVKIQIMEGKVCLSCKGKTLLGVVNKLFKTKSLLTSPSNVLPYYLK